MSEAQWHTCLKNTYRRDRMKEERKGVRITVKYGIIEIHTVEEGHTMDSTLSQEYQMNDI